MSTLISPEVRDSFAVLLLSGGKGTRANAGNVPKSLQIINDKPLMAHQLEFLESQGVKKVYVSIGHLGSAIRNWTANNFTNNIEISFIEDKKIAGTSLAIKDALAFIDEKYICVIPGDIMVGFDLKTLFEKWVKVSNQYKVMVVCHPNSHPHDSDLIEVLDGRFVIHKKSEARVKPVRNLAATGVVLFSKFYAESVEFLTKDYESSLFSYAIKENVFYAHQDLGYFADSGTPERLEKINKHFQNGHFFRRSKTPINAVIVDLDDTLTLNVESKNSEAMPRLFEDVPDGVKHLNELGIPIFVLTNQPGIAKGFFTESELADYIAKCEEALGKHRVFWENIRYCPHHPEVGFTNERLELKVRCSCRKPNSGMWHSISESFDHKISPLAVIGDSDRDFGLAKKLGVEFLHVTRYSVCGIVEPHRCFVLFSDAVKGIIRE